MNHPSGSYGMNTVATGQNVTMPDHHPQPQPNDEQPPIAPEHLRRRQEIIQELGTLGFCLPATVGRCDLELGGPKWPDVTV